MRVYVRMTDGHLFQRLEPRELLVEPLLLGCVIGYNNTAFGCLCTPLTRPLVFDDAVKLVSGWVIMPLIWLKLT